MVCVRPDQIALSLLGFSDFLDIECAATLQSVYPEYALLSVFKYLPYFFLTFGLEWLVLFVLSRFELSAKTTRACLLINLCTHPLFFYSTPWLSYRFGFRWDAVVLTGEVIVFLVEFLLWQKLTKLTAKKALMFSLLTNLASWTLGAYLFR